MQNLEDCAPSNAFLRVTQAEPVVISPAQPGLYWWSLADIDADTPPLHPLPPDPLPNIDYPVLHEPRCLFCQFPQEYRTLAEHIYLHSGKNVNVAVRFFAEMFGCRVSWTSAATHLRKHCLFASVRSSGLDSLQSRAGAAEEWRYRERSLALTGLMAEVDDVRGLDCTGRPELAIKRGQLLRGLYRDLAEFSDARDRENMASVNLFEFLQEVYAALPTKAAQEILQGRVVALRRRLDGDAG